MPGLTAEFLVAPWVVLLGAAILDGLVGGPRLLGRLPGVDQILYARASWLREKLNRPDRSPGALHVRATLVLFFALPLLFLFGAALNGLLLSVSGALLSTFLVAQITGQTQTVLAARDVRDALNSDFGGYDEDRFSAARWAVERLAFRLGDGLVANAILFLIGGFALLLPFRFLSMLSVAGVPSGIALPTGAFDRTVQTLFQSIAAPLAVCARGLVAAALVLAPVRDRNLRAALLGPGSIDPHMRDFLASRTLVLTGFLYGLGLNTAVSAAHPDRGWIGPTGGRARVSAQDVDRARQLTRTTGWLTYLCVATLGLGLVPGGGL